jgi:hypothetical protein
MELKDAVDTDTGRFCGDCYHEITRDLTVEELERRASWWLGESRFRASSLWMCAVAQAISALLLVADPGLDTLAFFGAVLCWFAAYALGVLMEVYGLRRRVVLTSAVFLEVAAAFLWVASILLMERIEGVPKFPMGVILFIPAIMSAYAVINKLVRAYEGGQK